MGVLERKRLHDNPRRYLAKHKPLLKVSPEIVPRFMELIMRGLPPDGVCDYLGIPNSTFWEWLKKGENAVESKSVAEKDKHYADFYLAFRKASAEYRLGLLDRLHRGKKNWTCFMTILERRDRPNFSKYDQGGGDYQEFDPDEKFF